ncbi:MAG: glycosyltransferase family 39 protein [Acidimicrobiia bacterium]
MRRLTVPIAAGAAALTVTFTGVAAAEVGRWLVGDLGRGPDTTVLVAPLVVGAAGIALLQAHRIGGSLLRRSALLWGWIFGALLPMAAAAVISSLGNVGRVESTAVVMAVVALGLTPVWLTVAGRPRLQSWLSSTPTPSPLARWAAAGQPTTRVEAIVAAGVLFGAVVLFALLIEDRPLGPDESVYAVKGRAWLEGTPDTGWAVSRPPGLSVIGSLLLRIGHAELVLRWFALLAAVGMLVMLWRVGRSWFGAGAGVLSMAVFAGAHPLLRRVPEFLNDIVTAGLLLIVAWLVWSHFEGMANRWLVLAAAPVAAAAFYLRYGVAAALAAMALVGAVIWRRELKGSAAPLLATAAGLTLLLIPHFIYAVSETGSVTGIISLATEAAGRDSLGDGLVTYAGWFPSKLAGIWGGLLMGAGIVAGLGAWKMRDRLERTTVFAFTSGLVGIAVAGTFVHAEQRYVFFQIALLTAVGAGAVVRLVARWWPRRATKLAGAAAVLVVVAGVVAFADVNGNFERLERAREPIQAAGLAMAGDECRALAGLIPQVTWYSGCATYRYDLKEANVSRLGEGGYLVLFTDAGRRQPEGQVLEQYRAVARSELEVPDVPSGSVDVLVVGSP